MQATLRERVTLLHQFNSIPTTSKRKLRVLSALYLNPYQNTTNIAKGLRTNANWSVTPLLDSLLNEGYIIKSIKPLWTPQIQAWRQIEVYSITSKSEQLLREISEIDSVPAR